MNRTELITRFYTLHQKVQHFKPELDEYEKLKKELLTLADDNAQPDEQWIGRTKEIEIQISPKANQARIPALFKIWQKVGSTKFIHNVTMTLKACRELVPTAEEEGLIVTEQTGPRRITAVVALKKTA